MWVSTMLWMTVHVGQYNVMDDSACGSVQGYG